MSGHPGIVTVHDAGILGDNRPYLVMELCEGGSLTKWVKAEERPSAEQVREVGVRIADALSAAHARGVLHRDVKPANILIDSYGHAGLADFGLAALPDPGNELSDNSGGDHPGVRPTGGLPPRAADRGRATSTRSGRRCTRCWPDVRRAGSRRVRRTSPTCSSGMRNRSSGSPASTTGLMDALLTAMATDPADRPTAAGFRDRLNEVNLDPPHPHARRAALAGTATASAGTEMLTTEPDRSTPRRHWPGSPRSPSVTAPAGAVPDLELLPEHGDQKTDQRALAPAPRDPGGRGGGRGLRRGPQPDQPAAAAGGGRAAGGRPTSTSAEGSPASELAASPSPTPTRADADSRRPRLAACPPEPECWGGVDNYCDSLLSGGSRGLRRTALLTRPSPSES